MPLITYGFDRKTQAMVDEMQDELGVDSTEDVLRKALALLRMAQQTQVNGGHVILEAADGTQSRVKLS